MGIVSCVIPVSASVFTINPGTGNVIQAAINSASSGDTIILNPGTYSENGITITGKSLTLRAADGHGPSDTIIDGKSAAPRIFTVTDTSSLTIENLALRNGRAGDAVDCGDPFISLGNECGDGGYGGAIYSGGNIALRNSTITGSKAGNGAYGSDPVLGLGGNGGSGGHGGAIYATGAVTLTSSSISGCFAGDAGDGGEDDPVIGGEGMGGKGGSGGAIYAMGTVTLTSSTVTDNHAGNGGAGANQKPSFKSVGGSGGAIYGAGIVTLASSTISNCSAGTGGAGGNDNWGYDGGSGGAISAGGAVTIISSSFPAARPVTVAPVVLAAVLRIWDPGAATVAMAVQSYPVDRRRSPSQPLRTPGPGEEEMGAMVAGWQATPPMVVLGGMVAQFTQQARSHSPHPLSPAARPAPAAQVVKASPFVMAAMAAQAAVVAQFTRKILLRSGPLSLTAAHPAPVELAAPAVSQPTTALAAAPEMVAVFTRPMV